MSFAKHLFVISWDEVQVMESRLSYSILFYILWHNSRCMRIDRVDVDTLGSWADKRNGLHRLPLPMCQGVLVRLLQVQWRARLTS